MVQIRGGTRSNDRDGPCEDVVMRRVVSVNVGRPQTIARATDGEVVSSAIVKAPVEGRVRVEGVNLAGDDQADRSVHGGPTRPSTRTPPRTPPGGRRASGVRSAPPSSARTSRSRAWT